MPAHPENGGPIDFSDVTGGASTSGEPRRYVVRKGDSLSMIARQFYHDAKLWKKIYEVNKDNIKNPDLIHPGQELTIPDYPLQPQETQRTNRPVPRLMLALGLVLPVGITGCGKKEEPKPPVQQPVQMPPPPQPAVASVVLAKGVDISWNAVNAATDFNSKGRIFWGRALRSTRSRFASPAGCARSSLPPLASTRECLR